MSKTIDLFNLQSLIFKGNICASIFILFKHKYDIIFVNYNYANYLYFQIKRCAMIVFASNKILINIEKSSFITVYDYFYKRVFLCNFTNQQILLNDSIMIIK